MKACRCFSLLPMHDIPQRCILLSSPPPKNPAYFCIASNTVETSAISIRFLGIVFFLIGSRIKEGSYPQSRATSNQTFSEEGLEKRSDQTVTMNPCVNEKYIAILICGSATLYCTSESHTNALCRYAALERASCANHAQRKYRYRNPTTPSCLKGSRT